MHRSRLYMFVQFLARPRILFYALPWLMVLLVIGTLAQRYIGLYEAERLFFASYVLWLGPVPMPGMYPVLALMGISLLAKLILKSPWRWRSSGTIITHIGAALLLLGALLTAVFSEEGFMALREGQAAQTVSDYHARELAILKNDALLLTVPLEQLAKGQRVTSPKLPFTLRIQTLCHHCIPAPQVKDGKPYRGIAQKITLKPEPLRKENEENQFGAVFSVEGAGKAQDGIYLAYEIIPHHPTLTLAKDTYVIKARKAERALPFSVQLHSFRKTTYPGSDMAQEYESVVELRDGALSWQAPIRMNEPLRYRGYTFYQSSFLEDEKGTTSVLAVVKNAGRVFPYIASIVMCVGLLLHLIFRLRGPGQGTQ